MEKVFSNITKYSIYLLVFLLPLFWLPFSFEVFEFNKQYLLFFLISLALFAWLAKMVIFDKEIRFKKTPLDAFVLAFLGVAVLSVLFSVDKSSSLYGFYGRFSDGLAGLLSLGILYFLITNNVGLKSQIDSKLQIPSIINLFLWSVGVVVLMAYFSIFGVWVKLSEWLAIPSILMQQTFNSIAGSLEGLSVFLAVAVGLLVGLMTSAKTDSKKTNAAYWLLLAASLGLMVIIDFTVAWIILLATLVLYVGFSLWKRIFRENVNKLLIPMFLIIVAAALIPYDSSLGNLPQEQVLSRQTSWQVSFNSVTDSVKTGFLGSGIGTFHYDFAKHKPLEINNSWLWQIRFDRAGSHFAEVLATMGFLGLLSYLTVIGLFLMMGYLLMAKIKNVFEAYPYQIPLLLTFLALVVGQFVYYQNTALAFAFWLVLGLSMVSWQKPIKEKVVSFKDFPELSLIISTVVIILGVAILSLYFFAAKFYLADVNYSNALAFLGEERVQYLEKAVKLNPNSPRYRVALSRTYLYEALQEAAKPQEQQNTAKIQTMVAKAIDEARRATELQLNQVANWESLGVVYREITGVAAGAIDWGIRSFERAIELEPTNPVIYTEAGKMYLAKENIETAKSYFNKAIEVKPDYAEARIQLALLSEREDALDEAIAELESFVENNPLNIDALFQLGRLYFNNGQIDEAIEMFSMVVILIPEHSNARYSLGVAYSAKGERQMAIQEFERVLELNPGNQDVIQKLKDLKTVPQQPSEESEEEE